MSPGEADTNDGNDQPTPDGLVPDDLALARRAATGDTAAFGSLMDRHADGLFRICHSLTTTRSDAEDLLQELWVGAYGSLKSFNGASSVKTWLTSILMRQAAKAWHRNRHHRQTRSIDATLDRSNPNRSDSNGASGTLNDFVSDDGEPTSQRRVDLRWDLQTVLQRMDPSHREILILREIQQLSYEEIARSLNVPKGTVESRLFRARTELKRRMRDYRPESASDPDGGTK